MCSTFGSTIYRSPPWSPRTIGRLHRPQSFSRDQDFADGVQVFSFRNARWHLLDVAANTDVADSVGTRLSERLFRRRSIWQTRARALFVVLRYPPTALRRALRPPISSMETARSPCANAPTRRSSSALRGESVTAWIRQCWQGWQGRCATVIERPVSCSPWARSSCTPSRPNLTRRGRRRRPENCGLAAGRSAVLKVSRMAESLSTISRRASGYLGLACAMRR